jgi:hypothetical protein
VLSSVLLWQQQDAPPRPPCKKLLPLLLLLNQQHCHSELPNMPASLALSQVFAKAHVQQKFAG